MERTQRATGAVIGSAVGDALGGPFEFGPAGAFSGRFPASCVNDEMRGGGGWDPGEATDDTQMAVMVAESLLEHDGLDRPDMFARFQRWAASDPKDIGIQTEAVLAGGDLWDLAAGIHFQITGHAAGNGSLMRASTSAVYFASGGQRSTMDAARRIAALTHGDRAAWEGTAVFHELIRVALDGGDPLAALPDTIACIDAEHRGRYTVVLDPAWRGIPSRPRSSTARSGPASAQRSGRFEQRRASKTRSAPPSTSAATRTPSPRSPAAWTKRLHVPMPGSGGRVLGLSDLLDLAHRLAP